MCAIDDKGKRLSKEVHRHEGQLQNELLSPAYSKGLTRPKILVGRKLKGSLFEDPKHSIVRHGSPNLKLPPDSSFLHDKLKNDVTVTGLMVVAVDKFGEPLDSPPIHLHHGMSVYVQRRAVNHLSIATLAS